MSVKLIAAACMAALVSAGPAMASSLILNGGFESAATVALTYEAGAPGGHVQHYPGPPVSAQYLPNWTIGDPTVSDLYRAPVAYSLVPGAAAEGAQFFSLNWSPLGGVILDNTVSQGFTLGAGSTGITFATAMSTESGYALSTLQVDILNAANVVVAQSGLFTHGGGNGVWSQKTWAADLTPGDYTLRLHGIGSGNAWDVLVDDVRLDSVMGAAGPAGVPEPASWALMILGLGGVGAMLRRRQALRFSPAA